MKRTIISTLLPAAALFLFSCEKGKETPPPSLNIGVSEIAYNSAKLSFEPENASECAYLLIQKDDAIPTEQEILSDGQKLNAGMPSSFTVTGLQENMTYVVAAVASDGERTSGIVTEEFTTTVSPYDIDLVLTELDGEFYGDWLGLGNDNFYLVLSDIGLDEFGSKKPNGTYLTIDLYSPTVENQDNPIPATGEYTADSSDEEYSINGGYTFYCQTDANGDYAIENLYVSGGTLTLSRKDLIYTLDAVFEMEDGQILHCRYEGPMYLPSYEEENDKLPLLDEDINTAFKNASATNNGNKYGPYNVSIVFSDMEYNSDGKLLPPGNVFKAELMTSLTDGRIDSGEYKADPDGENLPFTFTTGLILDFYGIELPTGTYVQNYDEEGKIKGYGFIDDGTITVTDTGSTYEISLDLKMQGGHTLKASYSGEIGFDSTSSRSEKTDRRMMRATF